jgi:hypothetical protein
MTMYRQLPGELLGREFRNRRGRTDPEGATGAAQPSKLSGRPSTACKLTALTGALGIDKCMIGVGGGDEKTGEGRSRHGLRMASVSWRRKARREYTEAPGCVCLRALGWLRSPFGPCRLRRRFVAFASCGTNQHNEALAILPQILKRCRVHLNNRV